MWGPDQDMPDGPWWLLIHARTQYEIDALIASVVVREVAAVASEKFAVQVARSAESALQRSKGNEPAEPTARVAAIDALADYEEKCGNGRRWPGPRPHWLSDVNDPVAGVVISSLQNLVQAAGAALQEGLSGALSEGVR